MPATEDEPRGLTPEGGDAFVVWTARLAFRAADKFFKFGSWMIFVLAIRYAAQVTGSGPLKAMDWVATGLFGLAVSTQALYLAVRDPADFCVPKAFRGPAQVIQMLLGVALFTALFGPQLFLDQILAALLQVRTK